MRLKFFWIPARDSGTAAPEVNAFLAQHRVVSLGRSFVAEGTNLGSSVCGEWIASVVSVAACSAGGRRVWNADAGQIPLSCR